mgnify:CR=1 FL=1
MTTPDNLPPNAIAVIGMAGRFPGADSVTEFWENLLAGARPTWSRGRQLDVSG